jgi:hypothetical protein
MWEIVEELASRMDDMEKTMSELVSSQTLDNEAGGPSPSA